MLLNNLQITIYWVVATEEDIVEAYRYLRVNCLSEVCQKKPI